MSAPLLPRPVVVSGPSGAGKSTLLKRLFAEYPGLFGLSVSHTTRKPRPGETDGVEYHFTDREKMLKAIEAGEFVESAQFGGNLYGTSKQAIKDVAAKKCICVLDIEKQGCESIRKLPEFTPLFIFVKPPSIEELKKRLASRGTETPESLEKRLAEAASAMEYGTTPGKFDVVIENDDIERAYAQFKAALQSDIENVQSMRQAQQQHHR